MCSQGVASVNVGVQGSARTKCTRAGVSRGGGQGVVGLRSVTNPQAETVFESSRGFLRRAPTSIVPAQW